MAGGTTLPGRAAHRHPVTVDDVELRELVPRVLSVLVCRGVDFAPAEDAVQEALIRALAAWGDELPADPTGWLITVAWRAFLDMTRSDAARRDRDLRVQTERPAAAIPSARAPHGPAHQPRQAHGQSGRCRSSRRRAHGDAGAVPRL